MVPVDRAPVVAAHLPLVVAAAHGQHHRPSAEAVHHDSRLPTARS
jgi:hypothetical protein